MKKIGYLLIVVLTCFLITGCSSDGDDKMLSGKINAEINIKDYGVIKLELDADSAPITVTNFVNLVNDKFYDGLTFHRRPKNTSGTCIACAMEGTRPILAEVQALVSASSFGNPRFPYALIPATTALGTIHPQGREMGLRAGANVVMPNLSPVSVRKLYTLYEDKICTGEESAQCRSCLERRVASAGYAIVTDIGDVRR